MVRFPLPFVLLAASFGRARSANNTWYPDWSGGSQTCLDAGTDEPLNPLFVVQTGFLKESRVACCTQYYGGTRYNACIEQSGGTLVGTNQFYADWTATPQKCAKDCPVSEGGGCGGILGPGVGSQYTTAALCCENHFGSYKDEYCAAISEGGVWGGTDWFYLDSTENICIKDCDGAAPCGGLVTQDWQSTYATVEECCTNKLPSLDAQFCAVQSNPDSTGTNRWFVKDSLCKKDCVGTGDQCASYGGYGTMYDTASACCAGSLSWVQTGWCESRSDPDTHGIPLGSKLSGMWFPDYSNNVCQRDCAPSSSEAACAALASAADLYATARSCCDAKLMWIDGATCDSVSVSGAAGVSTGTTKWYADFSSAKRCVMDCDASAGNPLCGGIVQNAAGESLYDSSALCCAQKFSWYQQDLCKALSDVGVGNDAITNLWYIDWQGEKCVQDCPSGTVEQCGGNPASMSEPLYDTAATCCTTKLGYLDGTVCVNRSTATATTTAGTSKWYADYSEKKCVQDCAVAPGLQCGGIDTNSGTTMYDTPAACCAAKFSWMNGDLCSSQSTGNVSGLAWPDQTAGICYLDCAVGTNPLCSPVTDLSSNMYSTIAECCTTANSWATASTCQQIPESASGTDEWWINWSLDKCVKNCAVGQGTSCGGLAENWDTKFGSSATCCGQPAFAWKPQSDCVG